MRKFFYQLLLSLVILSSNAFADESTDAPEAGSGRDARMEVTGKYYTFCFYDLERDSSKPIKCYMKQYPADNYPDSAEFAASYLGGKATCIPDKGCSPEISGPHSIHECIGADCPQEPSSGEPSAYTSAGAADSFEGFCQSDPTSYGCVALFPNLAGEIMFPEIANKSLTDDDVWGCAVILCLAAPAYPKVCVPPIKKLWKHLFKGRPFPKCTGDNGTANVDRYWTTHGWKKHTSERFPQYDVEGCKTMGRVNHFTYQSGKPDLSKLKGQQAKHSEGSIKWNYYENIIAKLENQPPFKVDKYFVTKFTVRPEHKDAPCPYEPFSWDAENAGLPPSKMLKEDD